MTNLERSRFEAFLGNDVSFWNYLKTYHNAFNILVKNIEETNVHVDTIAYPMLFLLRHCLELGFKANIRYFSKFSEKYDFTNSDTHNIRDLYRAFKNHIDTAIKNLNVNYSIEVDKANIEEFEQYYNGIEQLINQFDIIDKDSFCFRYPVDLKNRSVFDYSDKVNILDIKKLFDNAMVLINFTSSVFSIYTNYFEMIEEAYEEEMRIAYGDLGR